MYEKFLITFPNINSLAVADMGKIISVTKPLGLTWRSKLLKQAAIEISARFHGKIPINKNELLTLPGIGDYISSAIIIFSGQLDDELIDTNTVRVICRINGERIYDGRRKEKGIRQLYSKLKNGAPSAEFAYSLIDLASLVCLPRVPRCKYCVINTRCKTGMWMSYPVLRFYPPLKKTP